jgi:hypothetical protein
MVKGKILINYEYSLKKAAGSISVESYYLWKNILDD